MDVLLAEAQCSPPATSADPETHRHTWLMVPEEAMEGSPCLALPGPLLRGNGFAALPMTMARRARHGDAKALRRAIITRAAEDHPSDDKAWRRPGDAMTWRSAATITNLLGSTPEMGYHLLTPLTPISEEEMSARCWWTEEESRRVVERQWSSDDDGGAKRKLPVRANSMPNLLFDWTACCSAPCSHLHSAGGGDGCCSLSSLCYVDVTRQIPWPSWPLASFWQQEPGHMGGFA